MSLIVEIKHLSGSLAGQSQRVALKPGQTLQLGRDPASDIKFNEQIDDQVSGVHAKLSLSDGRLYIEDQRSSNGTLLNGSPCPAFQKIAVPDGARIRLAKQGPEMQVTFQTVPEAADTGAAAQQPPAPPGKESSVGEKQAVGRETLLREIDRAKQEERDVMAGEVAKAKRSTGLWIGIGGLVLVVLLAVGLAATYFLGDRKVQEATERVSAKTEELEQQVGEASKNVWADIERQISPSTVHLRCSYHLKFPELVGRDRTEYRELYGGRVEGSGVLIKPGVIMTAAHVVEPWSSAFKDWEGFKEQTGVIAEIELLDVQFPGQQPVIANVIAVSEVRDLALLGITPNSRQPVVLAESNDSIGVTDEVAIFGYPGTMGQYVLLAESTKVLGEPLRELKEVIPTFLRGTVTLPVSETAALSHHFFLDASVDPGSSGGPVVNREGEVIGIISQRFEEDVEITFKGATYVTRRAISGSVRAVSPKDIQDFLRRAGML